MGTRLKKSRSVWVWLCFFLGVNILIGMAALCLPYADEIYHNFGDIMAIIRWDIKDTDMFKQDIADRFEHLMRVATGTDYMETYVYSFSDEGDNLIYYAENLSTGKTIDNLEYHFINKDTVIGQESGSYMDGETVIWDKVMLPEGYDYYLYYNGNGLAVQNRYKTVNVYNADSGYHNTALSPYVFSNNQHPEVRILLMVKEKIVENPYAFSRLYWIWDRARQARWICFWVLGAIILDFALMLIALVKRKKKREFDRTLARLSGRLLFEVKAIISVLILRFFLHIESGSDSLTITIAFILCLWWFYVMLIDLAVNRGRFFAHNSINWLISLYKRYESKKPVQKNLLRRIYVLIAIEMVLVFFAFGFAAVGHSTAPLAIPFVAVGIYLLYRYLRRFGRTVSDLGQIIDRIEAMKSGEYETIPALEPDSDLYRVGENLTRIQNGIQKAVEEKVKSERMKMELITNVSHDLKTPLTSIISYTDLISKEEGLSETVKDYIQILIQKSDRLKTLIQDLFELSKAASGNMVLNMERIDLVRLVEQTLADMNEHIEESGLIFRVNMPDKPVYIMSDGRRLYRVFQNLISNALKYSMKSSRVYVNLTTGEDNRANVEIKNISSYEINFDSEEIVERFVRGDKARSTEGAGLGLAIARNFTHACGGSFSISIDGDLFKVMLGFEQDNGTVLPGDNPEEEYGTNKGTVKQAISMDKETHDVIITQRDEKPREADILSLDQENATECSRQGEDEAEDTGKRNEEENAGQKRSADENSEQEENDSENAGQKRSADENSEQEENDSENSEQKRSADENSGQEKNEPEAEEEHEEPALTGEDKA